MNSPYCFELAVVFGLTSLGGIVFADFAQFEPKGRRVIKTLLGGAVAVAVSATLGRGWFFGLLGLLLVLVAVIHAWWLPRNGVNGLTAEPRERYFALRGWKLR